MLVNAGVRLDHSPTFDSQLAPRAGLVLLPTQQTTLKLLYGTAFRAPNSYELLYYEPMRRLGLRLQPEEVRSTELVWEQYFGTRVRSIVSAFTYTAHDIIEQRAVDGTDVESIYFANADEVTGTGVEFELEAKLPGGVSGTFSHAFVDTDSATGSRISNSPRHVAKFAVLLPVSGFFVGMEGQYVSDRMTIRGTRVEGGFIPNMTLSSPARHRLDVSASLYNVFDKRLSDPGAEEHLQSSIPQDGRTFLARVRVRF
jgi:iron complex outermembrane receptor protein